MPGRSRRSAAAWRLDGASGAAEVDLISGISLADTNTVGSTAGPNGNIPLARSFASASTRYLIAADNAILSTENIDWSAILLFNLTDLTATHYLCGKDDNTANNREWRSSFNLATSKIRLSLQNSGTSIANFDCAAFTPETSYWHQLCLTVNYAARRATISVDAGARTVSTMSDDITASGGSFRVGAGLSTATTMTGGLANFLWFRGKVVNPQEEAWLYNGGAFRRLKATGELV